MEIMKYEITNIDFEMKVLVSMKDNKETYYYSYIDMDKEKIKKYIKDMLFIGTPTKFEIEKEIRAAIDSIFEDMIEEKKPSDLKLEIEDTYGEVVDIDPKDLEWDWVVSIIINDLKYEYEEGIL